MGMFNKKDSEKFIEALNVLKDYGGMIKKYIEEEDAKNSDNTKDIRELLSIFRSSTIEIRNFDSFFKKEDYQEYISSAKLEHLLNVRFNSNKVITFLSELHVYVGDKIEHKYTTSLFTIPIAILSKGFTDDGSQYMRMIFYFREIAAICMENDYEDYHTVVAYIIGKLSNCYKDFGVESFSKKDVDSVPHINISELHPKVECDNKFILTHIFPEVKDCVTIQHAEKYEYFEDKYINRLTLTMFLVSYRKEVVLNTHGLISKEDMYHLFDAPLDTLFNIKDEDTKGLYGRIVLYYRDLYYGHVHNRKFSEKCQRFAKTIYLTLLNTSNYCIEDFDNYTTFMNYEVYLKSIATLKRMWEVDNTRGYALTPSEHNRMNEFRARNMMYDVFRF